MTPTYRFGDFEVDLERFQLLRGGQPVVIEPKAMDLLVLLIRRGDKLVSKNEIMDALWPDATVTENALTRLIAQLRKALGDDAATPKFIATVPTRGYRFIGELQPGAPGAEPMAAPAAESFDPVSATSRKRLSRGAIVVAAIVILGVLAVAGWRRFRPAPEPAIASLAVLPLKNYTGDPDQEYFADGLTDELITDLSQLEPLRVISRTSMMRYKASTKSIPEIARDLDVRAVLEGSVMRVGDRVRVTVQLIDGATDRHLWAENYERQLGDSLAMQSTVARAIADRVHIALTPEHLRALALTHGVDPQVQEAYLRGHALLLQGTEPQVRKAVEWFKTALEKDPRDARSWSGLADANIALADFYDPPREVMPRAREAADRALAIDDTLASGHVARGVVRFLYEWDWAGADAEFQRAIALQPGFSEAHGWRAVLLAQMGRSPEAILEMQKAETLDPVSPVVYQNAAWVYFLARQEDRALKEWRKALEIEPGLSAVHISIWLGFLKGAPLRETMPQLFKPGRGVDDLSEMATLAAVYATSGDRSEAEDMLTRIDQASKTRWVCPYELAAAHAALGHVDRAMGYLKQGFEGRSTCMPDLKTDPRLDPLRRDPRFETLLRALAFPSK